MAKIYTKTGDKGETSLVSGSRVSKADQRIDLYGEVDELNSFVGFLATVVNEKALLEKIQSTLFNLGSQLACEAEKREQFQLPKIPVELVLQLEQAMDQMDQSLKPLKNFILPGGSEAAARAHLCRVIARRVERHLLNYHTLSNEALPENSVTFLNRLSDYFFVLSRYLNHQQGEPEVLWKPN